TAGLVGGEQIETDPQGRPIYDDTGDLIVAIDGQRFAVFDSVGLTNDSPQSAYLRERAGQSVVLTLQRADGAVQDVPVTLRPPGQPTEGVLGVVFNAFPLQDVSRDPADAVATGLRRTLDASTLILRGLRDLITNITNPQVSGPVGIVSTVGSFRSELPPIFMLWLIGLLSANLAVVNALPFPPMDGGRVAVSLIQALSGNRVTPSVERAVYLTGFVLLMGLLVWITFFDVGLLERRT
ncbi:MAG: RIP metalloprotease, partial [Chloroflexi bacterium]|nr:RIP metalloprotease [Chloroflexota bacterium]